ncbi:NAD(P)-dependent dehydrogenase (short-subunit alcohol dehydrogenase family) [Herbihabitans rhizosphaerae]|uniref:NAD(P)-dependent dehydrogenase (Short-subunit alcohol dehydrogenase family) n=1 Tax=Herbihabitans rhizosphaerae TaxID=1872711 RepID=A0A4Q7KQV1_9PSEU|nr:SDR family oxidoreductase [Herbihabitans rhizosphaerae]RZS37712.1 NAD(P)-dependent dehydrogenase (short-subunit alcohol dehydrogenase family) [Herbihabitans rhizosphaerae]
MSEKPLQGKVAVVTGATRGCGRGIAVELGALGATVFVTGRSTREQASAIGRPETIEETAELVDQAGGRGIPVRCDFTDVSDVDGLRKRIESEVDGRLDILVDDVWGGDRFVDWTSPDPTWWTTLDDALAMVHNGIDSHLIALHRLLPLLTARPGGLVIEVTDGDNDDYVGTGIPYFVVKSTIRALGRALGVELAKHGCVGLTVTPGFLRSEAMLEHFNVTEETWRDAPKVAPSEHAQDYVLSETPRYVGRGIAALATDPDVKRFAGRTLASWTLMREYGFTDVDGSQPDWGRWFAEVVEPGVDRSSVDYEEYR